MTPASAQAFADIAERLRHPPAGCPEPGWGQSLSHGAPGVALLHIERARTGAGSWAIVHAWAAAASRTPVAANPSSGLFHGAPAVAFALHGADQPGYAGALRALDGPIATLARRRVEQAHARIDRGHLPPLTEYDLISGLTGIGCHLLRRHPDGAEIRHVLSYLVQLTEPIHMGGEILPGWWTRNGPTDEPSDDFPGGHGNLGIAHGITGPLALLAVAMKRGVTVAGHADAIGRICAWTDRWRHGNGTEVWWPPWVTRDELRTGRVTQHGPSRPSWCYGTPGQARAQQVAAQATGHTDRQRVAEAALLGCVTDERQLAQLTDVSLCHGWAGLVQTAWRTAADASTSELAARVPYLRAQLLRHRAEPGPDVGLLDGAAGVALALHTTASHTPPVSGWDACLLTHG